MNFYSQRYSILRLDDKITPSSQLRVCCYPVFTLLKGLILLLTVAQKCYTAEKVGNYQLTETDRTLFSQQISLLDYRTINSFQRLITSYSPLKLEFRCVFTPLCFHCFSSYSLWHVYYIFWFVCMLLQAVAALLTCFGVLDSGGYATRTAFYRLSVGRCKYRPQKIAVSRVYVSGDI